VTKFYVGCHRPTTTLLLYPDLGQAVNGALAELVKPNDNMLRKYKRSFTPPFSLLVPKKEPFFFERDHLTWNKFGLGEIGFNWRRNNRGTIGILFFYHP